MDKSWINMPRNTCQYMDGLNKFLDFAFANKSVEGKIICPCPKCNLKKWQTREATHEHLILHPFPKGYTFWLLHGETSFVQNTTETPLVFQSNEHKVSGNDPIRVMVNDAFRNFFYDDNVEDDEDMHPRSSEMMLDEIAEYLKFMHDGQQSLYEGCGKYSKISFLLKLYHNKCLCRMTDKAMSMILELLADVFDYAKIPCSFYEAKKIINKLGLHYTKIDACPNDCMLYYGEDKDKEVCKKCNESRWKRRKKNKTIDGTMKKQKKVPAKVLRYFPLKPRLQRMFMSSKIAEHMQWHASGSTNEGILRHPRDSEAWKNFYLMNPQFASDARNVRLGLVADGFNPIVLIPYNLPPWMCMKQSSFILSMIIPGKRAPGNDIDVYLRPLIEELKELWNNGLKTFDSYSNEVFNMHAAILWTISDFPGLETLFGWNTHIGLACPRCNFDTTPKKIQGEFCFMNHRRWLNARHKFRLARIHFDGSVENRNPPLTISGTDVLRQVENVNIIFGKEPEVEELGKRQRRDHQAIDGPLQWRKKKNLCSKVLKVDELNQLQNRVVLTLCHMEILFPPAFFTVMVHLIVHLVEDAKLGGPV
ncbi:uncharacterized protein [Phaseolus vulgaris]|uniref:uncharacterized protein n=1 Tax=Phaseolus vulgaris TaxID=3885 RepID=UPI0035CAF244